MAKTAKRKGKATRGPTTEIILAKEQGRQLKLAIRAQTNVTRLAKQLKQATVRADVSLTSLQVWLNLMLNAGGKGAAAPAGE